MKTIITFLTFSITITICQGQSCEQKLGDATRAYYNGQLREVETLLEGCLEYLDRDDKVDAYKLLTDASLLLNEDDKADGYMQELLRADPLYQLRENDLQEFKSLRNNYEIISRYTVGMIVGPLRPDYQIMRHQSAAGNAEQPADYDEHPGIFLGVTGDVRLISKLYANVSLLYDRRSFAQEEIILGFQRVFSDETQQRLSIPLQLRYIQPIGNWNVFAGGGYGFHYLLKATGSFLHIPIQGDFPVIDGIPYFTEKMDITEQHKRWTRSWVLSGGVQRAMGKYFIELQFTYERGLSNLIDEDNRYFSEELTYNFAYVPDDVRVHAYRVGLAFYRNFAKPQKKK